MSRLLGFLFRLVVFVALVAWLVDQPGTARIVWHGYVIESSAALLGLGVVAVGFLFYLLFRLWHLVRHGPDMWRAGRKLKQLQRGQAALTQGLVAVAGGNAAEAGRLALAARKSLGTTTATLLLQAQAAQLAHDHRGARAIFRAMIEDTESAVLGYRGLIMEARRRGDWEDVERLTVEAMRLKPSLPWLDHVRFENSTRNKDWNAAGDALDRLAPTRLVEPELLRRYRAALFIAASQDDAGSGNTAEALATAEQAVKQTPDWLPALINLARRQMAGGYRRAARRTVENAWANQPHPFLAEVLRASESDSMNAYKQIEHLCRHDDNHPAHHLALAEAALAADIWGKAKRHLMSLIAQNQATQIVYRLLAKLERRESGDDRTATQWLTKAAEAPPDPAWLCPSCGAAHPDWQASCRSCGAFATLEWRSPGASYERIGAPVSLLSDWSE